MIKFIITLISAGFLISCTNHNNQKTTEPKIDSESVSFFPVTAFLKGQMAELDSLQLTPLHTVTVKGKTDSFWLKKEELKPLLLPFFLQEITEENLVSFFKATKFNDLSLNAVTFTYEPLKSLPDSIPVKQWNIYINPETGKITKVYLVEVLEENGKKYTKQLTWQTDKWAKINTFLTKPNGDMELVKEDKMIWDLD